MNISFKEFWDLTFAEFWAIHEALFGHIKEEKFNVDEYDRLMKEWENGNT
jgi:hypothetical protein